MQLQIVNPATLERFKLALNDDRDIWLTQIIQWRTYGGLLCGYPNRSANEYHVDEAKKKALEHFGDRYPITVLEPEVIAYDYPPSGKKGSSNASLCRQYFLRPFLTLLRQAVTKGATPLQRSFGVNMNGGCPVSRYRNKLPCSTGIRWPVIGIGDGDRVIRIA